MRFQLSGLDAAPFRHLSGMCDAELAAHGARRLVAAVGYACRVTLEDAEPGEPVLLLSHQHQPVHGPYRAAGPIFVRESASRRRITSTIPESFRPRLFSARAYDDGDMILDADVFEGASLEDAIGRFFADDQVRYIFLHQARRGCYAARVDRA